MICGKCEAKNNDVELYCKNCGADLQIYSKERRGGEIRAKPKIFEESQKVPAEEEISPAQEVKETHPEEPEAVDNLKKEEGEDTEKSKPLYARFLVDENIKSEE